MIRKVLYGIGGVVVAVSCFPLFPWYLLFAAIDLYRRHERKVAIDNTWEVFLDNPDFLRRILQGKSRLKK